MYAARLKCGSFNFVAPRGSIIDRVIYVDKVEIAESDERIRLFYIDSQIPSWLSSEGKKCIVIYGNLNPNGTLNCYVLNLLKRKK